MLEPKRRLAAILTAALLAGFITLMGLNPAAAQSPTDLLAPEAPAVLDESPPPSPNDIRELLRLLSDQSVIDWLKSESASSSADGSDGVIAASVGFQQEFSHRVDLTRARLSELAVSWQNLPATPSFVAATWQSQMSVDQTLRSITYVLIFLVVGSGLEWLYRQYTQHLLLGLEMRRQITLWGKFQAAVKRALLIFGGLFVFSIGAMGTFLSFDWPGFVDNLVLNLLLIVISVRCASTFSMFLLAPRVTALRLVPLSGAIARPLHNWIVVLATVATIGMATSDIFSHLAGSTDAKGAALAISVCAAAITTLLLIVAIWHMTPIIRRDAKTPTDLTKRQSHFWPGYLTILALMALALGIINARELMETVIIIGLVFPTIRVINGCIDHLFFLSEHSSRKAITQSEETALLVETSETIPDAQQSVAEPSESTISAATPEVESGLPVVAEQDMDDVEQVSSLELYHPVARRLARFVILIGATFLLLSSWGGNLLSLSESQTYSGRLVGIIADVLTAVLIADLVWVWAKSAIDRRLANYVPPQGSDAPGPEARMATLLPLLRVTLMVFLIVIVALTVLSSMGINIAPLIAGAGVLGIAIGFGAQALVKDIVSGIFFLIDDAFRIGEYIEVGDLRGTVESMSIRSLRVRHHLGAIHTIPFGELSSLTNYSRDWVIMRLEFRVPFDTDVKLIKKIVKKIGAELQENEVYGPGILQTLKSQGVRRMEEFNMVIGVKFMAKPGAQWLIRRDAYQKLRDAFEASGISFAQRNVTVEVVSDKELDAETKKSIAGAAQQAVESAAGVPAAAPDEP